MEYMGILLTPIPTENPGIKKFREEKNLEKIGLLLILSKYKTKEFQMKKNKREAILKFSKLLTPF